MSEKNDKKLSPDLDEAALSEILRRMAAAPKLDKDGDPVGDVWWSTCKGCKSRMNPRPRWLRLVEGKEATRIRRYCDICKLTGVIKKYDESDYEDWD